MQLPRQPGLLQSGNCTVGFGPARSADREDNLGACGVDGMDDSVDAAYLPVGALSREHTTASLTWQRGRTQQKASPTKSSMATVRGHTKERTIMCHLAGSTPAMRPTITLMTPPRLTARLVANRLRQHCTVAATRRAGREGREE